jgi:hypothetical protein
MLQLISMYSFLSRYCHTLPLYVALVKLCSSGLYHLQLCSQILEMSVLSRLKLLRTEALLESATPGCDEGKTKKLIKSS